MKKYLACALMAIGSLAAAAANVHAQNEANLQRRVSVDVNAVSPPQVLEMIARTADCTLTLDPSITEPVTIQVSRVTARTALNVVCESIGCQWRLDGRSLKIDAEPKAPDTTSERPTKPRLSQPLASGERVYRIGDGVTAPVSTTYVRPLYPRTAMQAKVQGQVDVEFVVLRDGTVSEVRVTRALSPELDEQAVAAVRKWLFTPAQLDGRQVAVRCEAQVVFTLTGR
jgi:protein TonB